MPARTPAHDAHSHGAVCPVVAPVQGGGRTTAVIVIADDDEPTSPSLDGLRNSAR